MVSLVDLTEDTLSCILSFLRPADVSACACACKRLRELCGKEGKAWLPMCQRRWGSVTDVCRWGNGRISHRRLYGILARWEHVIGFWRGVGNGGCRFLALFEWAPHCIVGHKVVPASLDTYSVRKIPYLWMSITEDGQMTCFLDPTPKILRTSSTATSPSDYAISPPCNHAHLDPSNMGMLSVGVHFVGSHHLVIEEIVQQSVCASNKLAEAATLAAFGSGHNLADLCSVAHGSACYSNVASPYSSSSESESCIGSPLGSFQHEMYQFLVSKVANTGGDRAARKQKRKDKERAWSRGKSVLEPEHFVKVVHASPTKARPLQGLWKCLMMIRKGLFVARSKTLLAHPKVGLFCGPLSLLQGL